MKRLAAAAVIVAAGFLTWYFDRPVMHFLGWDGQSSDNYAAWSGSVPAIIAAIGYTSLIAGVIHHVNCHQSGCWRIGRHRIGSGVWCSRHHQDARPELTDSDRLDMIIALLERRLPR